MHGDFGEGKSWGDRNRNKKGKCFPGKPKNSFTYYWSYQTLFGKCYKNYSNEYINNYCMKRHCVEILSFVRKFYEKP